MISLSRTHICVLKETEPKTDGPAGPTVISYRGVKDISQKEEMLENKQTNKRWTLQYHWGYTSHPLAVLAGFVGNHLLPPFYIINLLFKLLL